MSPPNRPPAKDRARRREVSILAAARKLSAAAGYLALRMADLAEASGVSIGTLYRHFPSKEDVITALAIEAWRGRLAGIKHVLGRQDLKPGEHLVAAAVRDVVFSIEDPELFGAEELAATRAVREGTSEGRLGMLESLHNDIVSRMVSAAERAVGQGAFKCGPDITAHARTIDLAVWTLMAGTSHIVGATPGKAQGDMPLALPPGFLDVCTAMFVGLGWCENSPRATVARIADSVLAERRPPL